MATSLTPLSALRALMIAPVPRPPQPIRPTRSRSLPAACTRGSLNKGPASAPAAHAVEVLRNSRREDVGKGLGSLLSSMTYSLQSVVAELYFNRHPPINP